MLRNQNVDAVGFAIDVIVDPFQFFFQGLGAESRAAQYTETAGAANGCYHVAAVAEGKQREFRANEFRYFESHV